MSNKEVLAIPCVNDRECGFEEIKILPLQFGQFASETHSCKDETLSVKQLRKRD
jgi:hypothetical protein